MTEWRLREQVLERDNYTCQSCKCQDKSLDTHHIIPRNEGGSETLDNLITYCHRCLCIIEPKDTVATHKRSKTTWVIDDIILQELRHLAIDDNNKPVQILVEEALRDYLVKRGRRIKQ